jgi:hypothetical protein
MSEEEQVHIAAQLVIVVHQGQVAVDTFGPGGLGKRLSNPLAVRVRGDLLAQCGQVLRARGLLEVGSQLRPGVQQQPAAPEESSRGPQRRGRDRRWRQQAATQEYGKLMGVDLVVFGRTPMERLHVQGLAEDEREAFVSPEVGQPGPREHAVDRDTAPVSVGGNDVQKGLRGRLHRTMHETLATLVAETDLHGTGLQIDATIPRVLRAVEAPAGSSS